MSRRFLPAVPPGAHFRRLLLSRAITAPASAAVPVLVTLSVLQLGGSAAQLSLVLTAGAVPGIVTLLYSGNLTSRMSPSRLIVLGDLVNASAAVATGVLLLMGGLPITGLAICSAASAISSALLYPAYGSLLTQVVDRDHLREANALRSMTGSAATIAGPALSGLAVALLDVKVPWFVVAVAFVAGAVLVRGVVGRRVSADDDGTVLGSVRTSWSYFISQGWLVRMTVFSAVWHMTVWAPLLVLGPVTLQQRFSHPSAWGYFEALIGVGGLLAAGPLGKAGWQRVLLPAVSGLLGVAVVTALFASSAPLMVLVGSGLVVGAALCAAEIFWTTAMQSWIPEEQLPHMLSYDYLVSVALLPVGLALVPLVSGGVGPAATLYCGAGIALVAAAIALAEGATRRRTVAETEPAKAAN